MGLVNMYIMNIDSIQTPRHDSYNPTDSKFAKAIEDFDGEYRIMRDNPNDTAPTRKWLVSESMILLYAING